MCSSSFHSASMLIRRSSDLFPPRDHRQVGSAAGCITHAGLNTVLEALAQGVPQVAIPVTNDQPGVGARIAAKKTGLVAPLKELTAARLSRLVDEVLTDSSFRDKARYFQKVIAETNGLSMAADILEHAFGLNRETGSKLVKA
jgi:zeaxanthin glucosyltransferase